MKYIDEFRDGELARAISQTIYEHTRGGRQYHLMEFCGGHTHAIHRYGIEDLLPQNVNMVHGPGCPVCVLPMSRIDSAIELARLNNTTLCTYGDMMRVPGSKNTSLLKAKANGADVRMVYSVTDALHIAKQTPHKEVVFFAIGFETTTPPTAAAIQQANLMGLDNFTVFCNHVLTPAAIQNILNSPDIHKLGKFTIDGFIGPAHVSTIIGSAPYDYFAREYKRPVVIAGFEPLDVMQSILMLVKQLNQGRAEVENEFSRAVTPEGNLKAQQIVAEVLEIRPTFEWRGLGFVPYSGLTIRKEYAQFDAERRFDVEEIEWHDNKACECGSVLRGITKPNDCTLFGSVCNPETPVGPCMVSSEGACAAYYSYGRFRDATPG